MRHANEASPGKSLAQSKLIAGRPHRLVACKKCGEWVWARWWQGGQNQPSVLAHLYHCDDCVPWEVE